MSGKTIGIIAVLFLAYEVVLKPQSAAAQTAANRTAAGLPPRPAGAKPDNPLTNPFDRVLSLLGTTIGKLKSSGGGKSGGSGGGGGSKNTDPGFGDTPTDSGQGIDVNWGTGQSAGFGQDNSGPAPDLSSGAPGFGSLPDLGSFSPGATLDDGGNPSGTDVTQFDAPPDTLNFGDNQDQYGFYSDGQSLDSPDYSSQEV